MKPNYIIIPLITLAVALAGSWLTSSGMDWYKTLQLPELAPSGSFIGAVWTIIFILSTISALIVWKRSPRNYRFVWVVVFFMTNALLNVFWSFLFFNQHLIGVSIVEMVALEMTVVGLAIFIWPGARLASVLLWPYAVWVAFATYLAYQIFSLN